MSYIGTVLMSCSLGYTLLVFDCKTYATALLTLQQSLHPVIKATLLHSKLAMAKVLTALLILCRDDVASCRCHQYI